MMDDDESQGETKSLRNLLRGAERKNAPWFFQARLLQRLGAANSKPVPRYQHALALAGIGLLLAAGTVSYLLLQSVDYKNPEQSLTGDNPNGETEVLDPSSGSGKASIQFERELPPIDDGRGPSNSLQDQMIEAAPETTRRNGFSIILDTPPVQDSVDTVETDSLR
jgi:hypothetical protein